MDKDRIESVPTPWSSEPWNYDGKCFIYSATGGLVASVWQVYNASGDVEKSGEVMHTHGRLIVAAPQMLRLLRDARSVLRPGRKSNVGKSVYRLDPVDIWKHDKRMKEIGDVIRFVHDGEGVL